MKSGVARISKVLLSWKSEVLGTTCYSMIMSELGYTFVGDIRKTSKASKTVEKTICHIPDSAYASDENDCGTKETQGNGGNQASGSAGQESSSGSSGREDKRKKPNHKGHVTYNEEDMKKESKRLRTFNSNWPHKFLFPKDLAEAGFYYVTDDVVRCAFCKIEIGRWEAGDIPKKEHRRWAPNCPFVRGLPCGNIPILAGEYHSSSSDDEISVDDEQLSFDVCGIHEEMRPFSINDDETSRQSSAKVKPTLSSLNRDPTEVQSSRQSLEKLGIRDMRAPVHPEYCSEPARLKTFEQWPMAMKQRPKDLAEAGFYYTGNGDQTICFHCGGGLKDWEDDDVPWVEHAKWFSKCHFLNLVKGKEFISDITGCHPAIMTAEEVRGLVMLPEVLGARATTSSAVEEAAQNAVEESCSSAQSMDTEVKDRKAEGNQAKDDGRLCKICYSSELAVVFLPCGHLVACVNCASSLSVCPVCRQRVTHTVRAFIP